MPLQIFFEQEEIHEFLRVDLGVDDLIIDILKESAMGEAETFLNTDFTTMTTTNADIYGVVKSKMVYTGAVNPLPADVTTVNVDGSTTTISYAEPKDAPGPVRLWVLQRMAQLYESRQLGTLSFGKTYQKLDYTLLEPYRVYPFRG